MDLGIDGRTALVMGASRGIGRGIAAALAREGARVALASRSREALEEAIVEVGGEAVAFEADTDDLERLAELPGEVEAELGPVEILVTNTGGPPPGGALDHGARGLAGRLPLARARPAGAGRGRRPGDARGAAGGESSMSARSRPTSRSPT